jgi:hypothetical protein
LGNNSGYGADDIVLHLLEHKNGYARYELRVSTSGDASESGRPPIIVNIVKTEYKDRPVITGMTVNHTNVNKFEYVLITGENLQSLKDPKYNAALKLYQTDAAKRIIEGSERAVNTSALEINPAGTEAKLYPKRAGAITGGAAPGFAAGEYYYLNIQWDWGVAPHVEWDSGYTTWPLNELQLSFVPNAFNCYTAVGRLKGTNNYAVTIGESMEDITGNRSFEEIVVTFESKDGFRVMPMLGGAIVYLNHGATSSMLVNGLLTLEPIAGQTFSLQQDGNSVKMLAPMKLSAKGLTIFSPVGSIGTLAMNFDSGTKYSSQPNAANPPTFRPVGDITMDVFGFNGFSAKYDSIKMFPQTVQLAGGLLLQVPGVNVPLAGLNIENLQLNTGNSSPGFDGIKADGHVGGSIAIITLEGNGAVDTFTHTYHFDGEVEIPVFEARGYLDLIKSERLGIPMLEAFHIQVAADKGIPLVPPATVGYLNGLEGGIFGLSSTLDYDPTDPSKPILPPLKIAAGARFQLFEVMEFWVELTAGPAYFKQSLHDAYVNLKGVNLMLIEELTMEVAVSTLKESPRTRVSYGYNARLRINLLKGIISDIFIAEGDLDIRASIDHPAYWIAKQNTYQSALALLNAINAKFSAGGSMKGILQVPQVSFLFVDFGPYRVAEAGAWFDMTIPLSSRITASGFKVGTHFGFGPLDVKMNYDFLNPWIAPGFDISLFSLASSAAGSEALYSETFGDANSGGEIVIGEGIRVVADSFAEAPQPARFRAFAAQSAGADISVYGDTGGFTHTVTIPNDGKSHWIQAASLVAGTDMSLTVYDPDGKPIALRPVPYNATGTAEQAEHGYNALRSEDGSGLLIHLDEPGTYRLTSNSEFRSWVMEADPKPAIAESKLDSGAISFKAENLGNGATYRYRVVLEKKSAYGDEAESTFILDEGDVSVIDGAFNKTLTLAGFNLNDGLESGNYFPTVLLYEISGTDNPVTEGIDEQMREIISVGYVYTPIAVTNTLAASIAPNALDDLTVTVTGNESINLRFSGATVASGFGQAADDSDSDTAEGANQAEWKPSHYLVNLHDETGRLAARAVDDGGTQTETPLSFIISDSLKGDDGKFDVLLAGIPGGHRYTVEVTPVFVSEYLLPDVISALSEGDDSMELEQKGVAVTKMVEVPEANPPQITIEAFKGTKESVNGTETYYLSEGSCLDIKTDQVSALMVRKYSSATDASAIKSASNTQTLRLTEADFADREGEIMSSGLFAITAKNAAGDTATELVNIVIDNTAPFLLIDGLTSAQRNAVNGSFTVTGSSEPGARVMSSTGHSAAVGADGRFALQGVISGNQEDVLISATDAAGNSTTESMTMIRVAGQDSSGGGSSGGSSGGASSTAGAHGYTITTPEGKPAVTGADGTITLPGGGIIKTPEGLTVTAPEGTTIGKDGLISIPSGKEAGIKLPGNEAQIGVSGGTTINRAGLSSVPVSGSAKILTADGTVLAAPGGTTIALNGTITPPKSAGTSVTLSSGLAMKIREGTAVILDETVSLGYRAVFENPFADAKAGDWFFGDVGFAYTHGLFAGSGVDTFSPNTSMTRGMIVTVLGRLHGIDTSGFKGGTFSDVDASRYYAAYAEWARQAGVVSGVGGNQFAPEAPVSRQDLAVILYNYIRFADMDLPKKREYENFADEADTAAYASEAVNALYRAGVISGKPGKLFDPKGTATRAEVAAMLHRFILAVSAGAVPSSIAEAEETASVPNPKTGSALPGDASPLVLVGTLSGVSGYAISHRKRKSEAKDEEFEV